MGKTESGGQSKLRMNRTWRVRHSHPVKVPGGNGVLRGKIDCSLNSGALGRNGVEIRASEAVEKQNSPN